MSDTHKWQLLALSVLIGALLYLLAPVLTPFAVAALIAYLGDPLVDRLEARRLSRPLAVTVVFLLFSLLATLVVLLLIPLLEAQVSLLWNGLPAGLETLQDRLLPLASEYLGLEIEKLDPTRLVDILKSHWEKAGGIAAAVMQEVSKSGLAILAWTVNLALLPVLVFYLLRDWDVLVEHVRELLPRAIEPVVSRLARESDDVLGAFLRGQLSVMVLLGGIYAVGLSLVGIEGGALIGMVAGLVSFIPYLGAIVGVGAGLIAAFVQHGDLLHIALVLAVFGFGQTVESFLLTPWLVGDKIGLHPVAVIFAIMAGGQLFGFFGVLLALPVAAVAMVLLRYAHQRYTASGLYGAPQPLAEVLKGEPDASDQAAATPLPPAATADAAAAATPAPGDRRGGG